MCHGGHKLQIRANVWSKYPKIGCRTQFFTITDPNLVPVSLQITPMTSNMT